MLKSTKNDSIPENEDKKVELTEGVKVYPNPVSSELRIIVTRENDQTSGNAILTSLSGKVMKEASLPGVENTMDLSSFEDGMYLLYIRLGKKSFTYKIIKAQ